MAEVLAEQVIGYLNFKYGGRKVAMLLADRNVFYAVEDKVGEVLYESPVTSLLQQVFDELIDQSFFILRKRLYTNYEPHLRDIGMVKVVAKRITYLSVMPVEGEPEGLTWKKFSFKGLMRLSAENFMSLENLEALSLSSSQLIKMLQSLVPRGPILHDYDRPVAAILVDGNGDLMAYGLNCNSLNKTLHAEVNLVQKYVLEHRQPIPFGSKIYVSHKPCKMCASMIFDCSLEREKVFVYYGDVPEGRMSTWTTLDEWSLNAQDPSLLS